MQLNHKLPWPMSIALKAIILKHLAHQDSATVLSFYNQNNSSQPVEIAIDYDGSIFSILVNNMPLQLEEQSNLRDWDAAFVEHYRAGGYKVEIMPLIDLEGMAI
ncbi:MAG: hypothetical protein WCP33_00055 [Deltaproteobacteria bacterium]